MTLFTSEKHKKAVLRTLIIYGGVAIFVAVFAGVYEFFSHNVYSASMVFAWRYPLILGVGMYLALLFVPTSKVPGILPACCYHFGVTMATVRAIFIGVIDIYGTTNTVMVNIYTVLAWLFVIPSVIYYLFVIIYYSIKKENKEDEKETPKQD